MSDGSIHAGLPAIPRLLRLLLPRWQQRKTGKLPHVWGGAVQTIVVVSSPGSTDLSRNRLTRCCGQRAESACGGRGLWAGCREGTDREEHWERWEGRRQRVGLLSLVHTVDFTQSLTEWLTWLTHYPRAETQYRADNVRFVERVSESVLKKRASRSESSAFRQRPFDSRW